MYAASAKVANNRVKNIEDRNESCSTALVEQLTGKKHRNADTINKICAGISMRASTNTNGGINVCLSRQRFSSVPIFSSQREILYILKFTNTQQNERGIIYDEIQGFLIDSFSSSSQENPTNNAINKSFFKLSRGIKLFRFNCFQQGFILPIQCINSITQTRFIVNVS